MGLPAAPAEGAAKPAPLHRGQVVVRLRHVTKRFGSATVLERVDLAVQSGEIHGLVGQNGSGKSTLIRLLSGVYAADPGSVIEVGGEVLSNPPTPGELSRYGLAFVHQDLGIVGNLTVRENICVGRYEPHRFTRAVRWRNELDAVKATLAMLGSVIDPDCLASTLHPGEQAVVAIARALHKVTPGSGCIAFDESTQSLPRDLLPEFYEILRRLAVSGTAVIIIGHRLDEILALADRVSVLQDGRLIAAGLDASQITEAALAALVLGREVELTTLREHWTDARPTRNRNHSGLCAVGLESDILRSIDFEAARGEVLGLTGTSNSGHEHVPYAIAGVLAQAKGKVVANGYSFVLPMRNPQGLSDAGVALVPQQRAVEGLALEVTALENLTLPRVTQHGRLFLPTAWQRAEFAEAVRMLGIVPNKAKLPVAKFSGGNQQKLLLAKWLLGRPSVLLMHEPTQAVDVGARIDILRSIRAAAASGVTVVLSSIETQDLAFVCDRVLVLRSGEVSQELTGDFDASAIESATYSSSQTAAGVVPYGG